MLFILFGSTAEMELKSRDFINSDFELIEKYNYMPEAFHFVKDLAKEIRQLRRQSFNVILYMRTTVC